MDDLLTFCCALAFIAAYGAFWLVLFRKAGYESASSVLMAIGMFIPPLNFVLAIYFASAVWPIQRRLSQLRGQAGFGTEADASDALSVATRLEARGDAAGAIAKYQEIIQTFPGSEPARDAQAGLRALRAKIDGP